MTTNWMQAQWPAPAGIVAGTTLRDSDFELPAQPKWLNQVHGKRVVHWDSDAFDGDPPEADAIISGQSSSICVVRTADCLPVLLCAADGSEIAAVHAGWRGLAAGVLESTLDAMKTPVSDLLVWFGPAISQPSFEVGGEVRQAFLEVSEQAAAAFSPNDRGRWQADLYLLARQRLDAKGVDNIYGGGMCTYLDPERFYSYRRDGKTGRLKSFIYRP